MIPHKPMRTFRACSRRGCGFAADQAGNACNADVGRPEAVRAVASNAWILRFRVFRGGPVSRERPSNRSERSNRILVKGPATLKDCPWRCREKQTFGGTPGDHGF